MENIKPNGQRATLAMLLIWLVLAVEVIALYSSYLQYDLLQTAAAGGFISDEAATANDSREQAIGAIYTVLFVVSAVTFILWFRRAYYNLHLKTNTLADTEGWAAGAWFVPFVCLYKPYQIMKEMYRETKRLLTQHEVSFSGNLSLSFLGWWWTLWIISNFLGQFIFRFAMSAESLDDLTTSTMASMTGNILGIPLALVTIKVIKDYAKVEPFLSELPYVAETSAEIAPDSSFPQAGLSTT